MNIKTNKEPIKFNEKICGCTQEQSVELDYVLPDYYPEIFRIIKCCAEPEITSCAVNGDRVTYELTVCLRVLYCPESGGAPQAVDQKLVYSRTVSLEKSCDKPSVYINASADNINCRAVNKRRIDVRGAVTVSITVMGETSAEIISEVFGGSVQLRKKNCACPSSVIKAQKRACISDEFEIGEDRPFVGTILRASAELISTDKKVIANKAAAKGELKISLLYTSSDGDEDMPVNTIQFSLPFSQLIDLEGLDDTYDCRINTSVISCAVKPVSDGNGRCGRLECEVMLLIDCEAVRMSMTDIVCDEYSTAYATQHTSTPVKIGREAVSVDSSISVKGVCVNKDSPIASVYDAWCSTSGLRLSVSDGKAYAAGNVTLSVMGKTEGGDIIISETDLPVEEALSLPEISSGADIRVVFSALSCSYTITSDNAAEVRAEIAVRGWITDYTEISAITEITVDETSPRAQDGEYALKLYFAEEGEELWDIAKRYGASMQSITEENELDGESVRESGMLLIPAV